RVPVRIALDSRELEEHPLQVGLSMQAEVDTHDREGARLPQVAQVSTYSTDVFKALENQADERVKAVIAANEGKAVSIGAGSVDESGKPRRVARLESRSQPVVTR